MAFGGNKIALGNTESSNKFCVIFFFFLFFMTLLYPTSKNGVIGDVNDVVIDWGILAVTILISMFFFSKIDRKVLIVVVVTLSYMVFISLISITLDIHSRISIARIAPVVCFLLLSICKLNICVPIRCVFLVAHVFMLIFLVWNVLIIIDDQWVKIFTITHYSQFYESATENMFIKRRPIMSFGIYTFACYFYFMFLLLFIKLYTVFRKRIFLIYSILILFATILLASNTTLLFSLMMIFVLIKNVKSKLLIAIIFLSVFSFLLFVMKNIDIVNYYLDSLSSESNGFKGRYTSYGSLNSNFEYLKEYFFIGFNIVDNANLTYTDSGFVVYYTMGGLFLTAAMYYCFCKYLKNNISSIFYLLLIPTLFFEMALPVLIYIKYMYILLFFSICIRSIELYCKKCCENNAC